MERDEVRNLRFIQSAAPLILIVGAILYAIGTITLVNFVVSAVGMLVTFALARWKLGRLR